MAGRQAIGEGEMGFHKIGESGVEGKCSLCGTYVIKGGVPYGTKSVLCGECGERRDRIAYHETAGRR